MSGIIDCEMHIGDEVFVHGYIDEIRNDTIIIRNVGGYFGTSRDEVFYYEEDERGYGTMNEADRKTESNSEKPNNCEDCANGEGDIEACGYCRHGDLYEPKDEPQTNADQHAQHIGSVESVEPTWTKEEHEAFYTFLWNAINPNEMQDYIEMFETKDDPQTEDEILREQCRAFMGIVEQTRREGE